MKKRIVFSTKMVEAVAKQIDDGFVVPRDKNPFYDGKIGLRKEKLTFSVTEEEKSEYVKCKLDVKYFANNYCKVKTEDGTYDIIKLRDYQYDILDMFQNPSNKFNILMASRQVGKTICSAIFILWYMLFHNDKNVLIAANVGDTAIEILEKAKSIYIGLPFFLKKGISVWNQKTIKFDNGSRAKSFTMTATSSIGQAADLVYLDEFAYIPPNIAEQFYKSIQPTLVAIEDSKMIITSTPNGLNLFHKLLTDAEREKGDPLKNNFASMRVYWYQVPGRNVTYLRLNQFKMANNHIDFKSVYDKVKEKFDPDDDVDANDIPLVSWKKNSDTGEVEIHIQNSEDVTMEDVSSMKFENENGDMLPVGLIGEVSSWKLDAIKNIGGLEAFNQEYDLRFINAAKSLFPEETIERIRGDETEFKPLTHEVFNRLKWDYSNLKFIDNKSLFDESARKKIKGVISVDVSEGLGQDYSVINIFRIDRKSDQLINKQKQYYQSFTDFFCLKQIGIFRSNLVSVSQLSELLYLLAFEYFDEDNFKIVLELNNHGHAVLESIRNVFNQENNYGSHIFFRFKHRKDSLKKGIGLKVHGNKKLLVKNYQERVQYQDINVYEKNNISEMTTFIKHETRAGNVTYKADGSCKDDCVPPETLIITDNGVKEIKDVNQGDMVLTHKGRYRKVTKIGNRHADYLYKITSNNKLDISLTSNHQLFLHEKENYTFNDRSVRFKCPDWRSIDDGIDIKKHYTGFIPNNEVRDIKFIDLYEYCDKDKFIIKEGKIYSLSGRYKDSKFINPNQNPIDQYLIMDENLCFIFGYYLAEGSRNGHQINFSCHKNEKNIREIVSNIFRKMGLNPFETSLNGNSYRLTVSSKILSNFFKEFGKSSGKKLPSFCNYLSNNLRRQIVNGYLVGDGCFSQKGIRSVSISPNISFYIYESLVKLGYKPSIKIQKQPKNDNFDSKDFVYCVNLNNYDKSSIVENMSDILLEDKKVKYPLNPSDKKSYQKFKGDYLIGKIRNIEKIKYNDLVYNLEVEEDNSYIANGIIVHNCVMTLVNMSAIFEDNVFNDMIEDFRREISDSSLDKLIDEVLKDAESRSGTDYKTFIEAARRSKERQRTNPFITGKNWTNEIRK